MNITKYCICILQLKYVSFLVSLTILSFSDCCQLLGKELGRERLLPYCSRGQWVWDWNICDWCLGQDHHGGHAQPSSPPSSPTRLKALEMLKPHQDLFFFFNPTYSWFSIQRRTKSLRTSAHPLTHQAGWDNPRAPEPSLFIPYCTLEINTAPLLLHLYCF